MTWARLNRPCSTRTPSTPRACSRLRPSAGYAARAGVRPKSQAAPRSTPLIFSATMCLRLRAEPARLVLHVDGDLLQAVVEEPHQPAVPTDPHPPAQVLRRDRVIGRPTSTWPSRWTARRPSWKQGNRSGGSGPAPAAPPRRSASRPAGAWCRGCGCRPPSAPSRARSGSARPRLANVRPFRAFFLT